jgi:hypothetical protein
MILLGSSKEGEGTTLSGFSRKILRDMGFRKSFKNYVIEENDSVLPRNGSKILSQNLYL